MIAFESLEALVVKRSTTGDAFSGSKPPQCAVYIEIIPPRHDTTCFMSIKV